MQNEQLPEPKLTTLYANSCCRILLSSYEIDLQYLQEMHARQKMNSDARKAEIVMNIH